MQSRKGILPYRSEGILIVTCWIAVLTTSAGAREEVDLRGQRLDPKAVKRANAYIEEIHGDKVLSMDMADHAKRKQWMDVYLDNTSIPSQEWRPLHTDTSKRRPDKSANRPADSPQEPRNRSEEGRNDMEKMLNDQKEFNSQQQALLQGLQDSAAQAQELLSRSLSGIGENDPAAQDLIRRAMRLNSRAQAISRMNDSDAAARAAQALTVDAQRLYRDAQRYANTTMTSYGSGYNLSTDDAMTGISSSINSWQQFIDGFQQVSEATVEFADNLKQLSESSESLSDSAETTFDIATDGAYSELKEAAQDPDKALEYGQDKAANVLIEKVTEQYHETVLRATDDQDYADKIADWARVTLDKSWNTAKSALSDPPWRHTQEAMKNLYDYVMDGLPKLFETTGDKVNGLFSESEKKWNTLKGQ